MMARLVMSAACVAALVAAAPDASAQARSQQATLRCSPMLDQMTLQGRASPYDSTLISIDGHTAKLCYGRPSARGRTMIGGRNVPYGQIWRTGANEPTTLHISFAAAIAGVHVDPGSYSFYTIPRAMGTGS